MQADALVAKARSELDAGRSGTALRTAWQAVNQAMLQADERPVRDVLPLAEAIAAATSGRERGDAETLVRYCRAVLDGVGGGVAAPGLIDRMLGRGSRREQAAPPPDRRRCPECAEDIHVDARVCRFCGVRLGEPAP
jgi:hypothetical protein